MRRTLAWAITWAALLMISRLAHAQGAGSPSPEQSSAPDASKANNPLLAAIGVNFQNYYVPELYGVPDAHANTMLVRGALPFKLGLTQLVRVTMPLVTSPAAAGEDPAAGIGDVNLFDILLLSGPDDAVQFGLGPQLTFPTHTDDRLGIDALQLGAALTVIYQPSSLLLLGALITWQCKIAGDGDANQLLTQPFVILQIGDGYYLRSTAIPSFDLESGDYAVPFGLGAGKVVRVDKVVFNAFIEPQFTLLHDGIGQPALQLFSGINLQLF